jgi:hypothetical protein
MAQGELDTNDFFAFPLFVVSTLFDLGLVELDLLSFLGDTLATVGRTDLTAATFVSLGALLWVLYTNGVRLRGTTGLSLWIIIVTFWLILVPPFVQEVDAIVSGTQVGALVAFLLQSAGYTAASYVE